MIQAALSRLIKDKTVLVIAHRMRTVSNADKVVVLSDGFVAEQGTPKRINEYRKDLFPHGKVTKCLVRIGVFNVSIK